jgi:glutamate N-acetyltransferase/amino-acid N-acetyltransferase
MIHPNMGTMLSFIVTDASISPTLLDKVVKQCVDKSFNMITVDGDTSTNDMVAGLANGMAENKEITSEKDEGYQEFVKHLEEMMIHLAKLIVSDGEGASKFIQYEVVNAPDDVTARTLVRKISDSNLVKTAMFGRDPNWGRIICAAGNAGVAFNYKKVDLYIGSEEEQVQVLKNGQPEAFDKNYLKKLLRNSHVFIKLDMKSGKANGMGWGADLTTDYVLFNSVYTT